MKLGLFICFIMSLFIPIVSESSISETLDPTCEVVGQCIKCNQEELVSYNQSLLTHYTNCQQNEQHCLASGMKVAIHCSDRGVERDLYRSCEKAVSSTNQPHHHHHATHVIVFQVLMALFGGLAYWGVRIRRENVMSQFDTRRSIRYMAVQT